jgi:2-polyprenyl-3-methyl-5-hydroxy-6-metoxy-1,4-benzoquinol methylase
VDRKELYYNEIANEFDFIVNQYDTRRRIEVIFDEFLENHDLNRKLFLDAGCGTGWFTKEAVKQGAKVITLDIGKKLVGISLNKTPQALGSVGSLLDLPFKDNTFEYIISSDVIEHTQNPYRATDELVRVLKPNGYLCLTVPNRSFWYFAVVIANKFHLRKYQGYENWVYYSQYYQYLEKKNLDILKYQGIHLFPFVFSSLNGMLRKLDNIFKIKSAKYMVNIAVYARKKT